MASKDFARLYHKATAHEHVLLADVQRLWDAMQLRDLQQAHRLALLFQDAHADFINRLEPIAMRMGKNIRGGCPNCGDHNCPGEVQGDVEIISPQSQLGQMLKGMMDGTIPIPPGLTIEGDDPPEPPE